MKIIPTILAGGSGKRFWPLSRENKPKQCLKLFSDEPMIVETYKRLANFDEFAVIANHSLNNEFKHLLPKDVIFVNEPIPRNTAPAIGLAAASLYHKFGDVIIFIETADHFYRDVTFYVEEIRKSCSYAEQNDCIVLVGIQPTEPHTGYGYIQQGDEIGDDFCHVQNFKEKPSLDTAKRYLAEGNYSWNSGMFISKASVLLEEIKKYLPELSTILEKIKQENFSTEAIDKYFPESPKISIDYGIMEKSSNIVVLPSSMHWDDIGDFNALARVQPADEEGNVSKSKIISIGSHGNIIVADKLVALIVVENLFVAQTDDVILIGDRKNTQDIKDILKKLDAKYL